MHLQLLVADWCSSCQRAREIWEKVCAHHGVALEVVDLESAAGEGFAQSHHLKIMPALLVDGHPRAVGVQTEQDAETLLARLQAERQAT